MRSGGRGRSARVLLLISLPVALLALTSGSGHAITLGQNASRVLGQPDYATAVNPPQSLRLPGNIIFDKSGNLWVADADNNRVIEFRPPFSNAMNFSLVIGQASPVLGLIQGGRTGLWNPSGMAFDSSGNLWVTDTNNNRVLEFAPPFSSGMDAALVIGQPSFTGSAHALSQTGLYGPTDVVFDSSGSMWITDELNHRVLEFKPPFSIGMQASLVLGEVDFGSSVGGATQSTLFYPTDSTFDHSGNLWVTDLGNNRVVEYEAPFSDGMNASLVVGQLSFATSTAATSRNGLSSPAGLAIDSTGRIFVADAGNNRVVEFSPPFSNKMTESLVIGQANFTAGAAATSQNGMNFPNEVEFDPSGNLWVADAFNNRELEFAAPFSAGMSASFVLGQSDFVSSILGGQTALRTPQFSSFDSSNNLWVVDQANNRILEFRPPFVSDMAASLAIGQPSFGLGTGAAGQTGLRGPQGLAFDHSGNLWISDQLNNRILEFKTPFSSGMAASIVLGQHDFTTSGNATASNGLYYPGGMTFDTSANLWVADTANSRVLEFKPPFSTGMNASLVIGQPGFTTRTVATSQTGFFFPADVKLDSSGSLWVSDEGNDRVLEFKPPFSDGMGASLVIGQSSFTTAVFSTTQNGLYIPQGLAFDSGGNLWVADAANSRVVQFKAPFSVGMPSSVVLGQTDFTSGTPSTGQSGMRFPAGVVFDSSGDLWVSDKGNNRVLDFLAASSTTTSTSTTTSSTTSMPTSTSTTTTSTTSTTASTTSSTSSVPEFPVGLPVILAVVIAAALISYSRLKRRPARPV